MRTYGLSKKEDAYELYGIHKDDGVIIAVRPDGYVGMLSPLTSFNFVEKYFDGCLTRV